MVTHKSDQQKASKREREEVEEEEVNPSQCGSLFFSSSYLIDTSAVCAVHLSVLYISVLPGRGHTPAPQSHALALTLAAAVPDAAMSVRIFGSVYAV